MAGWQAGCAELCCSCCVSIGEAYGCWQVAVETRAGGLAPSVRSLVGFAGCRRHHGWGDVRAGCVWGVKANPRMVLQ
jgi:hypothetical protein